MAYIFFTYSFLARPLCVDASLGYKAFCPMLLFAGLFHLYKCKIYCRSYSFGSYFHLVAYKSSSSFTAILLSSFPLQ
jgi:hypothetical protein